MYEEKLPSIGLTKTDMTQTIPNGDGPITSLDIAFLFDYSGRMAFESTLPYGFAPSFMSFVNSF